MNASFKFLLVFLFRALEIENLGILRARIGVASGCGTLCVRLDLDAVGVECAAGPETEARGRWDGADAAAGPGGERKSCNLCKASGVLVV